MSRLLISAAHKSSGKTTVSIGLGAALRQRGMEVQPYKKGPDYIDPLWLSRACGRDCINLDFQTMSSQGIRDAFARYSTHADISLVEGNKGLYDGMDVGGSNSNAALARLLRAPVILVIDTRGMIRGVAPLVLGYCAFEPDTNIAGIILNQVGGPRHAGKLLDVLETYTDIPVLGVVQRNPDMTIEERHLGLVPSNEYGAADDDISLLASMIRDQVDLDRLAAIAATAAPISTSAGQPVSRAQASAGLRIGVARDAAFGFYYPQDLDNLQAGGAELVFIDTLGDGRLPDIDGLFVGGGFPETQMQGLESNAQLRADIRARIESGLPVYAECGGLMYLSRSLTWQGRTREMVGAIPGDVQMHERPQGRGYVLLRESGYSPWPAHHGPQEPINAHEFHHSSITNLDADVKFAYEVERGHGVDGKHDGIVWRNVLANYAHLRDTDRHNWTARFLAFVAACKAAGENGRPA